MKILPIVDSHRDNRRDLTVFRPPTDFPQTVETKVIITKSEEASLGNHSHPHVEGFFLVLGDCLIRTWTKTNGAKEQHLSAPIMFMFEPGEEHVLICSKGMIIVVYMPVTSENRNNTPATHLT